MTKISGASILRVCCYIVLFLFTGNALPAYANNTFPSVDPTTQKTRDDTRRNILQTELASEKKAVEEANQKLSDAINLKQPVAKINALREDVGRHASNVDALNRELSGTNKVPGLIKAPAPVRLTSRTNISNSETIPPAQFWDVYRRSQVKANDETEAKAFSSGKDTVNEERQ